jgi:hypothetical protein
MSQKEVDFSIGFRPSYGILTRLSIRVRLTRAAFGAVMLPRPVYLESFHGSATMKAAVFREVHRPLTIEDVDISSPGPHEVLVRTVAAGV